MATRVETDDSFASHYSDLHSMQGVLRELADSRQVLGGARELCRSVGDTNKTDQRGEALRQRSPGRRFRSSRVTRTQTA